VLVLVFLVLAVLLRALLAPLLLVLSTVVSYFSALGAAWLVFDLGLRLPGLDQGVPLLSFLFLVALGVDYSVFLGRPHRRGRARRPPDPATPSCGRSPRRAASSPAPASCWPPSSPCSACCRSSC
jgi:RND superfamily putative drug exporter